MCAFQAGSLLHKALALNSRSSAFGFPSPVSVGLNYQAFSSQWASKPRPPQRLLRGSPWLLARHSSLPEAFAAALLALANVTLLFLKGLRTSELSPCLGAAGRSLLPPLPPPPTARTFLCLHVCPFCKNTDVFLLRGCVPKA